MGEKDRVKRRREGRRFEKDLVLGVHSFWVKHRLPKIIEDGGKVMIPFFWWRWFSASLFYELGERTRFGSQKSKERLKDKII